MENKELKNNKANYKTWEWFYHDLWTINHNAIIEIEKISKDKDVLKIIDNVVKERKELNKRAPRSR